MNKFESLLSKFDYQFPQELIAQNPASPRDSARLLVYDRNTKQIDEDQYKNLANYIPKNSVLVFNQTKVLPARLTITKPTGGTARILYIDHNDKYIKVLSDSKLEINSSIKFSPKHSFIVAKLNQQFYWLRPNFATHKIYTLLEKYGQTPLPPYIKHSRLKGKKLLSEYNTVFAKQTGSIAAPTASLHFSKSLIKKLKSKNIGIKYVTLHVGLGTFAKLTPEQIKSGKLHKESYYIDTATATYLNRAKQNGKHIIAVGTTVVRTLESAASAKGRLTKTKGATDLFITEHSKLKFVDQLITNFHVPKSSLLMLVSAFTGREKLLTIYKLAIKKAYRLFSFGDGMYIK